jgi:hypothetical protein
LIVACSAISQVATVDVAYQKIPAGPPIGVDRVWIAKMSGVHRQVAQDRVPQARI